MEGSSAGVAPLTGAVEEEQLKPKVGTAVTFAADRDDSSCAETNSTAAPPSVNITGTGTSSVTCGGPLTDSVGHVVSDFLAVVEEKDNEIVQLRKALIIANSERKNLKEQLSEAQTTLRLAQAELEKVSNEISSSHSNAQKLGESCLSATVAMDEIVEFLETKWYCPRTTTTTGTAAPSRTCNLLDAAANSPASGADASGSDKKGAEFVSLVTMAFASLESVARQLFQQTCAEAQGAFLDSETKVRESVFEAAELEFSVILRRFQREAEYIHAYDTICVLADVPVMVGLEEPRPEEEDDGRDGGSTFVLPIESIELGDTSAIGTTSGVRPGSATSQRTLRLLFDAFPENVRGTGSRGRRSPSPPLESRPQTAPSGSLGRNLATVPQAQAAPTRNSQLRDNLEEESSCGQLVHHADTTAAALGGSIHRLVHRVSSMRRAYDRAALTLASLESKNVQLQQVLHQQVERQREDGYALRLLSTVGADLYRSSREDVLHWRSVVHEVTQYFLTALNQQQAAFDRYKTESALELRLKEVQAEKDKKKIASQKTAFADLETKLTASEAKCAELTVDLDTKMKALKSKVLRNGSVNQSLQLQLRGKAENESSLLLEIDELKKNAISRQGVLDHTRNQFAAQAKKLLQVQAVANQKDKQIVSLEDTNRHQEELLERLRIDLQHFSDRVRQLEDLHDALTHEVESAKEEKEALALDVDSATMQKDDAEAELQAVRRLFEASVTALESSKSDVDRLSREKREEEVRGRYLAMKVEQLERLVLCEPIRL